MKAARFLNIADVRLLNSTAFLGLVAHALGELFTELQRASGERGVRARLDLVLEWESPSRPSSERAS